MTEARLLAATAEQLVVMADKLGDTKRARQLRHQATASVGGAIELTRRAVTDLRKAVGAGIGLPQEPGD